MLKHGSLTVLILVGGFSSWAQESPIDSSPFVPIQSTPNGASRSDDSESVPVSSSQQQKDDNIKQDWYVAQDTPKSDPSPPPEPGHDFGFVRPSEDLKVLTRRLDVPVPDELIEMVGSLLGPGGSYEYEDEIRLLVMRGTEERLAEANVFLEEICISFKAAFDEEMEKLQPQPVQIEAVLLIGRKAEGRVHSATEVSLPYSVPAEIAHLGLGEEDLLPFAFGEVEVIGRAVLQTDIPPLRIITRPVETTLGEHHLEFSLSQRSEPMDYPVLSVSVKYFPTQGEGALAPQGVEPEGAEVGAETASSGAEPESGEAQWREEVSRVLSREEWIRSVQSPTRRPTVGMKSEPKAVFDRPILVGSYKPNPEETAIVAIRLTMTED